MSNSILANYFTSHSKPLFILLSDHQCAFIASLNHWTMNIAEVQKKLMSARQKARKFRLDITRLRQGKRLLRQETIPIRVKIDYIKQNKQIFKAWKCGKELPEISIQFKISPATINDIYRKIYHIPATGKWGFEQYNQIVLTITFKVTVSPNLHSYTPREYTQVLSLELYLPVCLYQQNKKKGGLLKVKKIFD